MKSLAGIAVLVCSVAAGAEPEKTEQQKNQATAEQIGEVIRAGIIAACQEKVDKHQADLERLTKSLKDIPTGSKQKQKVLAEIKAIKLQLKKAAPELEKLEDVRNGAPIPHEWWAMGAKGIGYVYENPFGFGMVGDVKVVLVAGKWKVAGKFKGVDDVVYFHGWDTSNMLDGHTYKLDGFALRGKNENGNAQFIKVPDDVAAEGIKLANFEPEQKEPDKKTTKAKATKAKTTKAK